jgi:phytoene/squalene synthetase
MDNLKNLKKFDPDRFLLSFFVNDHSKKKSVIALDMLNVEIANIRDVIDTPHMGFIRLQWWKDEIKKIYAGQKFAPHPVLQDVAEALLIERISIDDVYQFIAAREADFEEYDDFDIATYARKIHAPLLKMKAKILCENENTDALAEGYALIGLLRAIPFYRARSQVLMPSIQPDAVRVVCENAEVLLNANKAMHPYFRAHFVLAQLYLKRIKAIGYQPEKLTPLPFKELRVWWGV